MSSTLLSAKDPVYESVKFTTESLPQSIFATTSERLKQYLVLLTQSDQHVHRMDQHPHHPPAQRSVDADILQVAAARVFQPVGDGLRAPPAARVRHKFKRGFALAVDDADDGAPGLAVGGAFIRRDG